MNFPPSFVGAAALSVSSCVDATSAFIAGEAGIVLNLFFPSATPAFLTDEVVGRVVVRDAGVNGAFVVLGGLVTLAFEAVFFSAVEDG